jgi:predicted Rossmann fold flavoprotein
LRLVHPDFQGNALAKADEWLKQELKASPRKSAQTALGQWWPQRMADAIVDNLGFTGKWIGQLTRIERLALAETISANPLDVNGDRGYSFAEATAGGVDLAQVNWRTMQSRIVPGLYLCGEVLDVDGKIGGFNFQWAWSSGYLAGRAAARAVLESREIIPN